MGFNNVCTLWTAWNQLTRIFFLSYIYNLFT